MPCLSEPSGLKSVATLLRSTVVKKEAGVYYSRVRISKLVIARITGNFVFSDYIDRITFQKQIWIFNEMTSLIKTFYNNFLFHKKVKHKKKNSNVIRFTKVLTKYSTEYNNITFIQTLCNKLNMDKKDLFSYFLFLKKENSSQEIIYDILASNNYDITKLEVSRLYRFLDKYYQKYDPNE